MHSTVEFNVISSENVGVFSAEADVFQGGNKPGNIAVKVSVGGQISHANAAAAIVKALDAFGVNEANGYEVRESVDSRVYGGFGF